MRRATIGVAAAGSFRLRSVALLTGLFLLAVAAPAAAGTLALRQKTKSVGKTETIFTHVTYRAAPGERNDLVMVVAGEVASVHDPAGVTPGSGCKRVDSGNATTAQCVVANGIDGVELYLGDLADVADIRGGGGEIDGGAGNDVLRGSSGCTFVEGPGDDRMIGRQGGNVFDESGHSPNGSDTMTAGEASERIEEDPLRSDDRVEYTGRLGPVTADLQCDRDDGERGEHDQIGADVESITGGSAGDKLVGNRGYNELIGGPGPDVLSGGRDPLTRFTKDDLHGAGGNDLMVGRGDLDGGSGRDRLRGTGILFGDESSDVLRGSSHADALDGGSGADRITGGGGRDTIDAGKGNDKVFAADHHRDNVRCNSGRDSVVADRFDALKGRERRQLEH